MADMKSAGFTPLEPYQNVSTAWTSLCNSCGTIVSPKLNNVRTRGRRCQRCAKYGLNPTAPTCLYIMAHVVFGSVKIGITGRKTREDRIERLQGSGWILVCTWLFDTGAAAYSIEQIVLKQLRVQEHSPHLTAERMPAGGWTETFDAVVVTADTLCRMVSDALTEPPV
ncbi:hypothetical protein [Streptomyces sp. NPDC060035]|uniref:hypothetical protein n=1 Tax=Streptomyces sp. NPDC060035 TaxID=3347044 RepID=UPI0036B06884